MSHRRRIKDAKDAGEGEADEDEGYEDCYKDESQVKIEGSEGYEGCWRRRE